MIDDKSYLGSEEVEAVQVEIPLHQQSKLGFRCRVFRNGSVDVKVGTPQPHDKLYAVLTSDHGGQQGETLDMGIKTVKVVHARQTISSFAATMVQNNKGEIFTRVADNKGGASMGVGQHT